MKWEDRVMFNLFLIPAFTYLFIQNEFTHALSFVWIFFIIVLCNRLTDIKEDYERKR